MTKRPKPVCPWTLRRDCECMKIIDRTKAHIVLRNDYFRELMQIDPVESWRQIKEDTEDCAATLFVYLTCQAQNLPLRELREQAKRELQLDFFKDQREKAQERLQ